MTDVALLGGSFNPPHMAHQMLALWALAGGHAEQVWLIPCYRHPLGKELAPFAHRQRMCELATAPFAPGLAQVLSVEQTLQESRTLLVLRHLFQQHPGVRFSLVIGADILNETSSWHRFDEIERLVQIVVVGRQGHPSPGDGIVLPDISSSEVRRRLRAGEAVAHLVPAPVLRYIEQHELYRDG